MAEAAAQTICVIIAAKNAADTIGIAIQSALNEVYVSEVVVVDDGSTDGTAAVAREADDGSGRLSVVSFAENRGPSAARNHAFSISSAPLIAILDADDFFFPGRFAPMMGEEGWDMIADNIAFIYEPTEFLHPERFEARARTMSLVEFVEGNISKRGVQRGETGFLKPVMSRAFLDAHGLRYREEMRLGEDYDFYVRALAKGARYKVIEHCGYGAIVRNDSLSSRHRTADLQKFYEADEAIMADPALPEEARAAVRGHRDHIRDKYELRAFLDVKREAGKMAAVRHVMARPRALPAIAGGIFRDKLDLIRARTAKTPLKPLGARYLLPGIPAAQK
ncbi:glycosyltransferase family 2 protein [Rhizobium terrae]|uniref:glycosyltransferase family 2 protein n=1 Tax=Rhizobium terrae TaxID=2171756 RepID=UPI000E3CA6CE|nr:glycosyltransferase family 2 protein [Rhizobium terrae]